MCHIFVVLKDTEEMQKIFDRRSVKLHRDRAVKNLDSYDFLFCEVARMLTEKLDDINRSFSLGLDLGCHTGQIEKLFVDSKKIETIIKCDISEKMVREANGLRFTADEEFLPVGSNLFDIVISCLFN